MKFIINLDESINEIMRKIGYTKGNSAKGDEFSIVRRLGSNDYPRFHLYIKMLNGGDYGCAFNLHLDQKKPSYEGVRRHSGEYDGDLVKNEVERIKQLLVSSL